jgi:predicted ATPase
MKRFILTGTPGCGKTSIIRTLEMKGHLIVSEAATDVIAYEQIQGNEEPWKHSNFIDEIIQLQKQRQMQIEKVSLNLQFYDRSPICTYALATYLGFTPSAALLQEIERIEKTKVYQKQVFFIENLGFCSPTDARKISFEESLVFEKIHEEAYAKFGYECIKIPPKPLLERVNSILRLV